MERNSQRKVLFRKSRKVFVIVCEGTRTEPDYFRFIARLIGNKPSIRIASKSSHRNSVQDLIERIGDKLRKEPLRKKDEAWIVLDKNSRSEEELNQVYKWSRENPKYHVALSNPAFELWLLLHYDDAKGISTSNACAERFRSKSYVKGNTKDIKNHNINSDTVNKAIAGAKKKDRPPCEGIPEPGVTTVYRLVEKILGE